MEMRLQQITFDLKELKAQVNFKPTIEQKTKTEISGELKKPEVIQEPLIEAPPVHIKPQAKSVSKSKTQLEDFIGGNLLNKVGIAVLVIGISFGVKYAIDHQMLNPLARVILGYLAGGTLIAFALRLKKNYHAFSAVLLSGGMATLYFITYAAYDLYGFLPQLMAFAIMVLFTAFTVFAALQYNLQVIAIIGLVGAYAVPFLLSDGSGKAAIMLSYVTIINGGILFISFKKNWRLLLGFAFSLTWLIYGAWMAINYSMERDFWLSLTFATIFFVLFYVAFLIGKLSLEVKLTGKDVVYVLLNCFIYYGAGYAIIMDQENGEAYLGLFTVANALIHFVICIILFQRAKQSKDTFYFVAGLVLSFLTLAVPVQLEGNWVTLIWAFETVLLFWIGRNKQFPVYETLAYPLAVLACISLTHDWANGYYMGYSISSGENLFPTPFFNIYLLTGITVAGMLSYLTWATYKITLPENSNRIIITLQPFLKLALPIALIGVLYCTFFFEVSSFFDMKLQQSYISVKADQYENHYNYDWESYKIIWLIGYSAVFIVMLWIVNNRIIQNKVINYLLLVANGLVILIFLSSGLNELEHLRYSYLTFDGYYKHGIGNLLIRYLGYGFIGVLLFKAYRISSKEQPDIQKGERLFFHLTLLTILSSELLNILALNAIENGFKLALSILWGAYALYLIIWGFTKNQAYLRISGIALFGITLLKLFFYDIQSMSTIGKTLVLMIMGVLLLVASFIYNKRNKKNTENETEL